MLPTLRKESRQGAPPNALGLKFVDYSECRILVQTGQHNLPIVSCIGTHPIFSHLHEWLYLLQSSCAYQELATGMLTCYQQIDSLQELRDYIYLTLCDRHQLQIGANLGDRSQPDSVLRFERRAVSQDPASGGPSPGVRSGLGPAGQPYPTLGRGSPGTRAAQTPGRLGETNSAAGLTVGAETDIYT
jgi:hypothetical protein